MIAFWLLQFAFLLGSLGFLISNIMRQPCRCILATSALLAIALLAYTIAPLWQYYLAWATGTLMLLSVFANRNMRRILLVLSVVIATFSLILGYLFPIYVPKPPDGPYAVGYTVYYHDMSQQPMHASSDSEGRIIPVKIWFPTLDPGEQKINFDEIAVGLKARYSYYPLPAALFNNLYFSQTAATNSTKAIDGRRPLVVYNHGGGSYPEDNRVLLEAVASHGYIVISLGHPLNTSAIRYRDGKVVHIDFEAYGETELSLEEQVRLSEQYERTFSVDSYDEYYNLIKEYIEAPDPSSISILDWIDETISVVQVLEKLPVVGAHIDKDKIVFAGYSFGAATAIELCRAYVNVCHSAISIDGLPVNRSSIMDADINKDILILSSNHSPDAIDNFTPGQFIAEQNSGNSYNILIPEATHGQFSSEGFYSPIFNMGYGNATFYRTHEIMERIVIGFLDRHVGEKVAARLPEPGSQALPIRH